MNAQDGNPNSQFALGCMYRDGVGVAQNLVVAREWFFKAAKQKHRASQQAFNRVQIEIELRNPDVSNVVRPIDLHQQGLRYLSLAKEDRVQNLDDVKAPPFCFGLPYKPNELRKGLGTARNP